MAIITMENLVDAKIDVFARFNKQLAIAAAGTPDDFGGLTIGWGMMGNLWGHPGSALTIFVSPDRNTHKYLQENELFTVSFFPEEYRKDVLLMGRLSGRDGNKFAQTALTPQPFGESVGFAQSELSFLCRKIYTHGFELEKTPEHMKKIYETLTPHVQYIGYIEDVRGEI